jgi:hypothetical protein
MRTSLPVILSATGLYATTKLKETQLVDEDYSVTCQILKGDSTSTFDICGNEQELIRNDLSGATSSKRARRSRDGEESKNDTTKKVRRMTTTVVAGTKACTVKVGFKDQAHTDDSSRGDEFDGRMIEEAFGKPSSKRRSNSARTRETKHQQV